jgi:hypothetical protein
MSTITTAQIADEMLHDARSLAQAMNLLANINEFSENWQFTLARVSMSAVVTHLETVRDAKASA